MYHVRCSGVYCAHVVVVNYCDSLAFYYNMTHISSKIAFQWPLVRDVKHAKSVYDCTASDDYRLLTQILATIFAHLDFEPQVALSNRCPM